MLHTKRQRRLCGSGQIWFKILSAAGLVLGLYCFEQILYECQYSKEVINEGYQNKRSQKSSEAERPCFQDTEKPDAGSGAEDEREVPGHL